MRQYRQLTEDDRIEIYAMKQAGKTSAPIALRLSVDRSTIYRELQRNSGHRGYRPRQAHQKALQRRQDARKAIKMTPETIDYIEQKIKTQHAPEQVSRRMKIDPHWTGPTVSHERIYQHIWRDKQEVGQLYKHPLPFDWAWIAPPSTENCNAIAVIAAIGLNRPTKKQFGDGTMPARRSK